MILLISSILLSGLLGHFASGQVGRPNTFEKTICCLQYSTSTGFNYTHPYFPLSSFRNLQVNKNGVKSMRLAVVGPSDAYIRLAPVRYPYDKTVMHEIVIAGCSNTLTMVRRYTRSSPSTVTEVVQLKEKSTMGIMTPFEPGMFTLAVHPNGTVELTGEGDSRPFLVFRDATLSANYVGFTGNWDVPLNYFFDCPFEKQQKMCEREIMFK